MSLAEGVTKSIQNPMLQLEDGTAIMERNFFKRIHEGYGFSISHRFEGVAADASADLYFENPANSGREAFIVMIEVVSFGQAHIDIYRGNEIVANGTKLTPVNLNFEKTITSVVNAEYGGTYTLGTLTLNTVCPGGALIRAIGGTAEVGETAVIPPNFNFVVRVTNKSGAATDLSIRVIWWEQAQ